ncbi:hypothetical protein MKEN_00457300 [Mycena kentingensis (nom. inval.)]|nr:hypothetical protein MKEN_00457300 [Mycena kentingensis (nom. inval.)]
MDIDEIVTDAEQTYKTAQAMQESAIENLSDALRRSATDLRDAENRLLNAETRLRDTETRLLHEREMFSESIMHMEAQMSSTKTTLAQAQREVVELQGALREALREVGELKSALESEKAMAKADRDKLAGLKRQFREFLGQPEDQSPSPTIGGQTDSGRRSTSEGSSSAGTKRTLDSSSDVDPLSSPEPTASSSPPSFKRARNNAAEAFVQPRASSSRTPGKPRKITVVRSNPSAACTSPASPSVARKKFVPEQKPQLLVVLDIADAVANANIDPRNRLSSDKAARFLKQREERLLEWTPRQEDLPLHLSELAGGQFGFCPFHFYETCSPDPTTRLPTSVRAFALLRTNWREACLEIEKPILSASMTIMEEDLLAVVVLNEDQIQLEVSRFFENVRNEVPRSQATVAILPLPSPVLGVARSAQTFCAIAGDLVAVAVRYPQWDHSILQIFDSGSSHCMCRPIRVGAVQTTFLTDTLVLALNVDLDALEIYEIPTTCNPAVRSCLKSSLKLPQLAPGHSFVYSSFECRGQRAPSRPLTWNTTYYFLHRPQNACIYVSYETEDADRTKTRHTFIIHRQAFLAQINAGAVDVPYTDWGPRCARLLESADITFSALGLVGQRLVGLAESNSTSSSSSGSDCPTPRPLRHIVLLDFNTDKVGQHADDYTFNCPKSVARVVPRGVTTRPSFVDPVHSELRYLEIRTKELFAFDLVFMEEQRVAGVKWAWIESDGRKRMGYLRMWDFGDDMSKC